jgi:hypothetical protein
MVLGILNSIFFLTYNIIKAYSYYFSFSFSCKSNAYIVPLPLHCPELKSSDMSCPVGVTKTNSNLYDLG